jgi:carboxyl-terminal processing protease
MPKMRFPKIHFAFARNLILAVFLISLSFSVGYLFGYKGFVTSVKKFPIVSISRETPVDQGSLDFSLFWRVWDTLQSKYYDKTKLIPSEMVYGAIRGMVAAVGDPYTVYLPPVENKIVQEDLSGAFEGVGIQIGFKGSQLAVIAPLPGSPAEAKGIKPGDAIIAIKDSKKGVDKSTNGMTLPQAVQLIRGTAGTTVTLALIREGVDEPVIVDIVRESINVPSVVVDYVKDPTSESKTVAHVRLLKFSGDTLKEWNDKIGEILTKPSLSGIIFDVRNNPGGYLDDAIELSSDFLETGSVVVKEEMAGNAKTEYRVQKLGRLRTERMVVLVNGGSASASEILAGALKDNKRAQVVGDKTFGKGTVQEDATLEGNGGLHVTIARWLTPNGTWVHGTGLVPDVEVKDDPNTPLDEQLQKALELITSSK